MDRLGKPCKKTCIICYKSPQNILVLACDHTVCLECAYIAMTHRGSSSYRDEIEFTCNKCSEITYFDKDLIKQIETSIQPERSQKQFEKLIHSKSPTLVKEIQPSSESFIEKLRNQYFSENSPLRQSISGKKKVIENNYQNLEEKIRNLISQDKIQIHPVEKTKSIEKQRQKISFCKEKTQNVEVKSKLASKSNVLETKCKIHPYYELIYFCMDCREIVCPQCLLRGQHKDHKNQSISQILEKELPDFINHASEQFLKKANQLQEQKKIHLNELNQKLSEIKEIRQNAAQYFMQVRKNIEKEERQVLQKCDELLHNLKTEQKENEEREQHMEITLSKNIVEIKSLKNFYKEFQEKQQCDTERKGIEKTLIHKYLSCLKSFNSFTSNNHREFKVQNKNKPDNRSKKIQEFENELWSESDLLNKRISEGIQSIRQSLVFETFSKPINFNTKPSTRQRTDLESRITQKLQPSIQANDFSRKLSHQNQYISYVSTQNSQSKSKQLKGKSRQKSLSISPYKGEISTSKIQQGKSCLPFKKPNFRESSETGKQNILHQDKFLVTEMKTELSTQNVSAKKCYNIKHQKSRHNSKSKSKNNDTAKSKKRNSICYNAGYGVNRFKL